MKIATCAAIASIAVLWTSAARAATCEDFLNHAYQCTFVDSTGALGTGCLKFTTPGTSSKIDIHANIFSLNAVRSFNGGCACNPKGSVNKPQFYASKTFECPFGSGALAAKASKTKISAGHITGRNGASVIFSCEVPKGPTIGGGSDPCPCQASGNSCGGPNDPACCPGLTCGFGPNATCQ